MKSFAMKSLALAALSMAAAPSFAVGNFKNNTMTNIVTVQGSCDIVAIGVDFGTIATPVQAKAAVVTANTTVGNALTGSNHQLKGHDGAGASAANQDKSGAGVNPDTSSQKTGDDTLALNGSIFGLPGLSAVAGTLSSLVGNLLAVPGVYVSCASQPVSVTLRGGNAGAGANDAGKAAYVLEGTGETGGLRPDLSGSITDPTFVTNVVNTVASLANGAGAAGNSFNATMYKVTGGAIAATGSVGNQVDYSLTFIPIALNVNITVPGVASPVPAVPSVPATTASLYLGLFPATGAITTNNVLVAQGDYADVATATVEY